MTERYFKYPFANQGDREAIPDDQVNSLVNYQFGYTPEYELNPDTDPNGNYVGRQRFNQVLYDMTSHAKQIQDDGYTLFFADVAYKKGRIVVDSNGNYYRANQDVTGVAPPSAEWDGPLSDVDSGDSDKLDGEHGSYYLNRSNHTGTQPLSTISDAGTAAATNTVDIVSETIKNQTGGKWVVHESTNGVPCIFYRMPAFTYETLNIDGCPFTGVMDLFKNSDGSVRPYHDFAVYMASDKNGDLVSVGGGVPVANINYDEFLQQSSDAGFQMYSVYERACLNWLMIANNFQPRGNTDYGRSHNGVQEFGRRQDGRVPNDRSGEARTLTGSGPASWNHDGTEFGIADLVGNQWEWMTGLKLVDGQFVVAEYHGQPEQGWVNTGSFINAGGVLDNTLVTGDSSNITWSDITKSSGYVESDLLQRLIIEPIDCTRILNGRLYYATSGERSPFVGGYWGSGGDAGPAALYLRTPRSHRGSNIGGRISQPLS